MGDSPVSVLSSAALAGATSTVILHPLEVVRSRMTCDQVGLYSHGITTAFRTIAKQEGPLVFYSGLAPALAAIMPEAAITYGASLRAHMCACLHTSTQVFACMCRHWQVCLLDAMPFCTLRPQIVKPLISLG